MSIAPNQPYRYFILPLLIIAGILVSTTVWATPKWGLGISITEDGQVVHCPVRLNNAFRLEGAFGFQNIDREGTGNDPDALQLKFGAYGVQNVYEKTEIYYGGKIIYSKEDTTAGDADGIGVAPTFGFEYYIVPHLSIGGEAEVYYLFYDRNTGDTKELGSDSRLVLRYYF